MGIGEREESKVQTILRDVISLASANDLGSLHFGTSVDGYDINLSITPTVTEED